MLFPGNACDVWPGELPPGWELEWVDDDEWLHQGQVSYDVIVPLAIFRCFNKLWTIYFMSKNYACNNGPYGEFDVNL
jgi:hypothetical protein